MPLTGARGSRRPVFHALTVASVEPLCPDAVAVTFDVPEHLRADYAFAAGQSLVLRRLVGGREERRSYSISAAEGHPLRIGVREIPGGVFSAWLVHEVAAGSVVEVQTPTGRFGAGAGGGRHLGIAAGSGITPVLSLAGTVLARDPTARFTLVTLNRSGSSTMFADELGDLKNRYLSRLHHLQVLTRESREAGLPSGHLDAERLRQMLGELVPLDGLDAAWLCGPFGLVQDARRVLTELGVPPERVHSELFHVEEEPPARPTRTAAGAPAGTSQVTVVLDGVSATVAVPRDSPVLDSARALRADLPFSCRSGVCGTCRARVTEGEVAMRRNHALEPPDLERGFVLTCQSLPVTDRVTVDYDA